VRRRSLGALFSLLTAAFAVVAVFAALAGGGAWIVAVAAAALSAWMGESAYRMFR
jgi:predicted DCC family thiol-disulfide oxidoreductase YuxK